MGILDNIKGLKPGNTGTSGSPATRSDPASSPRGGASRTPRGRTPGADKPGSSVAAGSPAGGMPRTNRPGSAASAKLPGKRKRKGAPTSPRERVAAAAAPLHDRRRRLVGARETTLRDLGGLMLEMYKRNRFREELLLDKCEEVLAIEVEIAHVDQRLFQLAPPNAAGMRPIGRCECGAPIHPGQNFCGVCGRSFATLTLARSCSRCGGGLRPGDQFCATCGNEAPDALQAIEAGPGMPMTDIDAASVASKAVADTVVIEAQVAEPPPPLDDAPAPAAAAAAADEPDSLAPLPMRPTTDAADHPAAEPAVPAPAPQAAPAGFDWSVPPAAAEAAIDTAVAAMPSSPTDPGTAFAGFPLSSTVPPPPIVDPVDVMLPTEPAVTVGTAGQAPAAPATPAPEAADPDQPAPGSDPDNAKAAERIARKAEAAAEKQRLKEAKARAKAKAKQARAARKRGGDG